MEDGNWFKLTIFTILFCFFIVTGLFIKEQYDMNQDVKTITLIANKEIIRVENDRYLTSNEEIQLKHEIQSKTGEEVSITGTKDKVKKGDKVCISIDVITKNGFGATTVYKNIYVSGYAK